MNYRESLLNNILPFWMKDAVDYENGGIYTCLDKKGNIFGTEKSVWFQGRALWVFSKAYNSIDKNPEYLKIAENIYKFLPTCTDSDDRMYFTVTAEGKEIQKRRYYYSETFAAIGCAEYYKATGDKEALAYAEKYFQVCYECYKGIRSNTPKFNPENCSYKALAPSMIMLATAQVMRSMPEVGEKYGAYAKECLDEIMNGGYLMESGLHENINPDGTFANTPTGRIVNPGHSLECAWFVLAEGVVTGNQEAIDFGLKIIDVTLPIGIDKTYGGVLAFIDSHGQPPVQLEWDMKLWWPQCEAMIALRLAYNITKDEKYNTAYEELKEYTKKYFLDTEDGEWYGYLHYDNTPSHTLKGNIFKGPFHIPRFYIINAILDETDDFLEYMK